MFAVNVPDDNRYNRKPRVRSPVQVMSKDTCGNKSSYNFFRKIVSYEEQEYSYLVHDGLNVSGGASTSMAAGFGNLALLGTPLALVKAIPPFVLR